MPGLAHLYIGEEAIAVGVCEALSQDDYITSTHRGHGHCLAKGATPDLMFAELLGKEAGYCKGKGGSMHIADPATGNLGANAIVCGSAGIATERPYASKYLKKGRVAVCFFGEGALGQGILYEEMNLAQLWKLPVIFVCENNSYNEYTHFKESTAGDVARAPKPSDRDAHDRWPGRAARSSGGLHLHRACSQGRGAGVPAVHHLPLSRPHVGDIARAYYRPKAEEQEWVTQKDPVTLHGQWLMDNGIADRATLDAIQEKLVTEMDAAVDFAVNAPYPDPSRCDRGHLCL
jgi:pyruvate dehydrogenase E1 component alpha subunit